MPVFPPKSDRWLNRIPTPVLFLALCGAGIALRVCLSFAMAPPAARVPLSGIAAAGAAIAAAVVLGAFLALLRRPEEWMLYLGAAFLLVLLQKSVRYRPEIAAAELPLALFAFIPAALLLVHFVRRLRGADELERRILGEALAIAFAIEFAATVLYGLGEGTVGLPRTSAIWWSALLVAGWSAGLAIARARYAPKIREA
jgi:hypothetical protein